MPTRQKTKRQRKRATLDAEATRQHLTALLRELRAIESVILVSIQALFQENACIGAHVAVLLRRAAGNKLDIEIERSARFLVSIGGKDGVFDRAGPVD